MREASWIWDDVQVVVGTFSHSFIVVNSNGMKNRCCMHVLCLCLDTSVSLYTTVEMKLTGSM